MTMDLKKYTKKQFADNTEYIEASPSGYPEWWRDFKMIVEDSGSINELGFNLMEFKQTDVPQWASGQIVFNPLVFDFLLHNPEYLAVFNKAHKKGAKHFKKTFFKKYPDERECKAIFEKYNNDFKNTILQGYGIFNKNVIELCGFNNGILSGYWLFESDHLQTESKAEQRDTESKAEQRDEDWGWFKVGLKFANGKIIKQGMHERPSFKQITTDAGLSETLRPYVSDTYQSTGQKNIFASEKKMTALYNYCIENNIDVSEWFLSKYKQIREKE